MRRRSALRPEINVTPLVDVVLVLLIIFMVVAPQMEAGAPVDVPAVRNPDAAVEAELGPVVVSVTAAGVVYVDRSPVPKDVLRARLEAVRDADPRRAVLLKGDRDAPYEAVKPVFQLVQGLGFPGAALQVGERGDDGREEEG